MPRKIEHLISDGSGDVTLSFAPTDITQLRLWASGLRQYLNVTFTMVPGSITISFADSSFPPAGDLVTADYPYATP